MEKSNERSSIELPTTIFGLLLTAALGGGAGLYGFVGPQLEKSSIIQCANASSKAFDMANRNAQDFLVIRQQLFERTADRYTVADHEKYAREQQFVEEQQNQRISNIERLLDRLEKRIP